VGDLRPGALLVVVSGQDSFAQIQRSGSHEQSLLHSFNYGCSFY
jgi:hypothetical protein